MKAVAVAMMRRDDDLSWRYGEPPRAGSRHDMRNRAAWSVYPSCSQPRDGRGTVAARQGHIGLSRTQIRREQRARRLRMLDCNGALLQRIIALANRAECQMKAWQHVSKKDASVVKYDGVGTSTIDKCANLDRPSGVLGSESRARTGAVASSAPRCLALPWLS